jgi:transcriptional regulator with XRE-family HTH domain
MRRVAILPHLDQPYLGALLRDLRLRAGYSANRLGIEADIDHAHVSRIENGRRAASRITLNAFADVLELDDSARTALLIAGGYWPHPPPRSSLWLMVGISD